MLHKFHTLCLTSCVLKSILKGSKSEYMYKLQTYGIPTEALPLDEEGNLTLDHHLDWIEQIRAKEAAECSMDGTTPSSIVMVPRRFDVLLGRGKTIAEHTGNLRAFHIVEMNRQRYERAGKYEKTQIAEKIVHMIQESYGRFLKRDQGDDHNGGEIGTIGSYCWIETTTEEARDKISHCFRRLRELESKQKVQCKEPKKPRKRRSRSSTKKKVMATLSEDSGGSTVKDKNYEANGGPKRPKS